MEEWRHAGRVLASGWISSLRLPREQPGTIKTLIRFTLLSGRAVQQFVSLSLSVGHSAARVLQSFSSAMSGLHIIPWIRNCQPVAAGVSVPWGRLTTPWFRRLRRPDAWLPLPRVTPRVPGTASWHCPVLFCEARWSRVPCCHAPAMGSSCAPCLCHVPPGKLGDRGPLKAAQNVSHAVASLSRHGETRCSPLCPAGYQGGYLAIGDSSCCSHAQWLLSQGIRGFSLIILGFSLLASLASLSRHPWLLSHGILGSLSRPVPQIPPGQPGDGGALPGRDGAPVGEVEAIALLPEDSGGGEGEEGGRGGGVTGNDACW